MEYKGISANPGKFTGKVCIVHNAEEFDHCAPGSIPVLVRVKPTVNLVKQSAGILAIHGGITSHAAIAARENNKPAVVGLSEDILNVLKNGSEVHVDASTGIVQII